MYNKNVKKNKKIHDILSRCKSVSNPNYVPTLFACNTWMNVLVFLVKNHICAYFGRNKIKRQLYVCPDDGGEVAIDFYDDSSTKALPNDAPILVFFHTISGTTSTTMYFMEDAVKRGYRPCVFVRRGHLGKAEGLKTPRFNFMGDTKDMAFMMHKLREQFEKSWIGFSAGSGLLISYLGQQCNETPVSAACCLCPAYALFPGLKNLEEKYPFADKYVLDGVKDIYLHASKSTSHMLKVHDRDAYNNCNDATSLYKFAKVAYKFAGCNSLDEYNKKHDPMQHFHDIRTPVLLLNSDDDMVCVKENVREDLAKVLPNFALVRTKYGSHIAYSEGWFGEGNFMVRLSLDWIDAAYHLYQSKMIA